MADKRDYYDVLGIDKSADEQQIKSAYRKLAKKYHPDLNPNDAEAEAKFKELGEAYEVLSDKDKKAKYDQFGHAGVDPSYGAGSGYGGFDMDLGDIFGSIFGGGFGFGGGSSRRSANPNAPKRGSDIHVSIPLSFMEAAQGCKKTVNIEPSETCPDCGGSGAAKGSSPTVCPDCHGTGYVTVQQSMGMFGTVQNSRPCTRCAGKGKIIDKPCPHCSGKGAVSQKRKLEIDIPAGINDDQSIQIRGRGNAGANGGPSGDVIAVITVRPDPLFERDRYDVYVTVPVSFTQAALGDEITVPTVDGKIKFTVPDGTQSGTTFRLRDKGIRYLNGKGRGDQYVKVELEVPKKLNREQKAALTAFESTLTVERNYESRKSFSERIKRAFGKE